MVIELDIKRIYETKKWNIGDDASTIGILSEPDKVLVLILLGRGYNL